MPCYDTRNFIETDEAGIKAAMLLQRVRGAGIRIENKPSNGPLRVRGKGYVPSMAQRVGMR